MVDWAYINPNIILVGFSKLYFNKNLEDLVYEDLTTYFIDERIESDKLEFKSYNQKGNSSEKFNGICKSIAAFLNSGGGLLIWGAPSGAKRQVKVKQQVKIVKIFIGQLEPIDHILEKDQLINKITDRITPLPSGIRVNYFGT